MNLLFVLDNSHDSFDDMTVSGPCGMPHILVEYWREGKRRSLEC